MVSSSLPNYLRTYRKRLGLSQVEISRLLGVKGSSKVNRYEHFTRAPSLETALACEVIFKTPARELFKGLYQKVEMEIAARAKALAEEMESAGTDAKRETFIQIAAMQTNDSIKSS